MNVHCAIVIPSPIITTQWRKELDKTSSLIDNLMKDLETARGDDLNNIADQDVAFIVLSTFTDPEILAKIMLLDSKRCRSPFVISNYRFS